MNIRDTHGYLVTLIEGLSITAPVAKRVQKVFKFVPPPRLTLTDLPCALLTFEQQPVAFGSGRLVKPYSIHIQFFAGPAEYADESADIAAAFLEELIQALSGSLRLGNNVSVINTLRNGRDIDSLTRLEFAGLSAIGLDLYLDVTITESKEHVA